MPDLDERLRRELRAHAEAAHPSADLPSVMGAAVGRRQRRRSRLVAGAAVVVVAALVGAALLVRAGDEDSTRVVTGPNPATGTPGEWTPMPDGPLSPRSDALAFTVGNEVVIFGGGPGCPPADSCGPQSWNGFVDGAAYDPAARSWRPLADMPHALDESSGTVIDDRLYVWGQFYCPPQANCPGESLDTFTSYDAGEDEWTDLPTPEGVETESPSGEPPTLTSLGERLVLTQVDATTGSTDRVYDPATNVWSDLPVDPLRPGHDRMMATDDEGDLYLFSTPAGGAPFDVAVLRAGASEWERLPASDVDPQQFDYQYRWYTFGDTIIWPSPSQSPPRDDGFPGDPPGQRLDTRADTWSDLPASDAGPGFRTVPVAGTNHVTAGGLVLDLTRDAWVPLPEPDGASENGSAAWVGDALVMWGGARLPDGDDVGGYDQDTGAVWTAPAGGR